MIWIIASVPFWLLAAFFFAAAIAGIIRAFYHGRTQRDFNHLIAGTVMIAVAAGVCALIAAKICS